MIIFVITKYVIPTSIPKIIFWLWLVVLILVNKKGSPIKTIIQHEIGKKTLDSINILNDKNINELKEKEKILKDLENKLISKKNIMSKENFDKEVLLFRNKANEFKEVQFKMTEDFNDYKKKELDGILSKISPVINAYIEKKSVKILLDSKNILIGRSNLNLTNEVLKEINEKIK